KDEPAGVSGPPGKTPVSFEGLRRALRFVVHGHRRAIAFVAATAFLAGTAEALFLLTVTRTAFAITGDKPRAGIVSGWYLAVDQTLLLALGLLLVRIALAAATSWQSAELSSTVIARVRRRL